MNSGTISSLAGLAIVWGSFAAGVHADDLEPIQVGQPQRLEVFPPAIKLNGPRRQSQIGVTGIYADGSVQDLTRAVEFAPSDQKVFKLEGTLVKPIADGTTELILSAGGQAAKVPVEVTGMGQPQAVSFEYDTLAALNVWGSMD